MVETFLLVIGTRSPTHFFCSPTAHHAVFIRLVANALFTVQCTDTLEILRSQGRQLHEGPSGSQISTIIQPANDCAYIEVILLSAGVRAPRHNNNPTSDMPREDDLGWRHFVFLGQVNDRWVRPDGIVSCGLIKVNIERKASANIHLPVGV